MVKFLVKRPIAVLMSTLAISVLGFISFLSMPVSLLPDIDIPQIRVRVNYADIDARSLENTIIKPLRQELMQVGGLSDIKSETSDGFSEIRLNFSYATGTEYAYIEVNEKVDAIAGSFPRDMDRPVVIKLKPSDIPVFYISIVPTADFYKNSNQFQELSEYVETVVKRRIEQLSEVSVVDISGLSYSEISIRPYVNKMENLGFEINDITEAIRRNNIHIGNLLFRDGHYVYRLRFNPSLKTLENIKEISIGEKDHIFRLSDIAEIITETIPGDGMFFYNGSRAISIAVYKQSDARMQDIKSNVEESIRHLKILNPDIEFVIERDQTYLLDYSIKNLQQTLLFGIILAVLIMFLFIRQARLPLIISISIPISLIISFLFLRLLNISINVISLSGLILSVGLMIDNSIIVIDNINQYRSSGENKMTASIVGTNEVIRPLISSVLTTCAVFIPMIALSGIAGAIFFDQALTISVSLIVSLFISIIIIPVLYSTLINKKTATDTRLGKVFLSVYEKLLFKIMNHKWFFLFACFILIPVAVFLYLLIDKEKLPVMKQSDFMAIIEWNEPISLSENKRRTLGIVRNKGLPDMKSSVYVGKTGFALSGRQKQSVTNSMIYLDFDSIINVANLSDVFTKQIRKQYPLSNVEILPSENIFQAIFNPENPAFNIKFRHKLNEEINIQFIEEVNAILSRQELLELPINMDMQKAYEIYPEYDKLLLYNIDIQTVITKLKVVFGGYIVDRISKSNKIENIYIRHEKSNIFDILLKETIKNREGEYIPLNAILSYREIHNLRSIKSDKLGEYYDVSIKGGISNRMDIEKSLLQSFIPEQNIEISFSGNAYDQYILFNELLKVLLISIVLLYLILAAQFESLLLPLIILIEILIDISGALFFLYIFNISLNLMSALGIIVMSGIILNDSIIKIDTIRKEYNKGNTLLNAIIVGGRRRFYPIVITSLTTIFALLPLLFFKGIGVELQLPLALPIIGGLLIGTIISLFLIPVLFFFLTRLNIKLNL